MKEHTQQTSESSHSIGSLSHRSSLLRRLFLTSLIVAGPIGLAGCGDSDSEAQVPTIALNADSDVAFGIVTDKVTTQKYFNILGPDIDVVFLDICVDSVSMVDPVNQLGGQAGRQAAIDAIDGCEKVPAIAELEDQGGFIREGLMVRVKDSTIVVGGSPDGVLSAIDVLPLRQPKS